MAVCRGLTEIAGTSAGAGGGYQDSYLWSAAYGERDEEGYRVAGL